MTFNLPSKRISWYIVIGVAALGVFLTYQGSPDAELAPVSKSLDGQTQHTIDVPIKVYSKEAKKKLVLPKPIQADGTKVVLTATDLPVSKAERTVSAVLDTTTGETTQYVTTKPLPLFTKDLSGSLGVYAGLRNLDSAIRVEFKQDLFSIKAIKFGATASVDLTNRGTDTFVGVGGRLEW